MATHANVLLDGLVVPVISTLMSARLILVQTEYAL